MNVVVRQCALLREKDEDGLMQVALILKPCDKKKAVKYMLYTADPHLVWALEELRRTKDPVDLEALDILLTAAEWPTTMQ